MKHLVFALFFVTASIGHAENKRSLLQLELEYEQGLQSLEQAHAGRVATLQKGYKGALEKLQASMQKRGDLDATRAVKKDLTDFESKVLGKAEMAALRPEIAATAKKPTKAETSGNKPAPEPPDGMSIPPVARICARLVSAEFRWRLTRKV